MTNVPFRHRTLLAAAAAAVLAAGPAATAESDQHRPDLSGVYRAVASGVTLPDGLRNSGAPREVPLRPESQPRTEAEVSQDPAELCQVVGPFRMMAREGVIFEIVPVPALRQVVVLFEDVSRGNIRTILLDREHPEPLSATWQGHSIGRWEGDTLVIDTIGFNDRTWLNETGATHSDALRLIERVRPVLDGRYLQYQVTAHDPAALVEPYTYVRYFEKVDTEIAEDVCEE